MAKRLALCSIAGIGTAAYLTKPSNDSFAKQVTLKQDVMTKVITTEIINYFAIFDDYVFFKVVTLPSGDEKEEPVRCIGVFNTWLVKDNE